MSHLYIFIYVHREKATERVRKSEDDRAKVRDREKE